MKIVDPQDKVCLLLKPNWFPFATITARAAFHHLLGGRILALDANHTQCNWEKWTHPENHGIILHQDQPVMRSAHDVWAIPTVAMVQNFFYHTRVGNKKVTLQRLLKHYKNTCQFCLRKLPSHMFNKDHVFPRSQGGTNHDFNIVLSCVPCNTVKADQYPYRNIRGEVVKARPFSSIFIPEAHAIRPEWHLHLAHLSLPDQKD